jgi:cytochrome P450
MRGYIDRAATDRLRHPRDDVLTTLVGAERDGGLSPQERTGICVLLFLAGISTAAGLISTSLYLLATDLEQRARLIESPEIIPAAVEELLRFVSPVQALARVTMRPAEIAGVSVPEGARVLLVHAAANRDPRRFEDPDRLDLLAAPQRNLAFGEGIHFCLGAHLARLQTRVVLETLLPMMPAYGLDGPVRWMTTPGDRGLESVPIAV